MKKNIFLYILFLLAGVGLANIYSLMFYRSGISQATSVKKQTVVTEESAVTQVVKKTLPSAVTVGIDTIINSTPTIDFNPSNPLDPFTITPGQKQEVKQNIGSGFIISGDGLIVTNKHVVADTQASYKVVTSDGKKYDVTNIYRDPLNDIAVLKINAAGLQPLQLGNSDNLQLGQLVIAIGTPLGEFQNTVTTGVISGLKRGIVAGSDFQGSAEQLNNVIQTDAPINPGNSGGPLLDSAGEVVGINTAISQQGQNLGFAIPVNTIKTVLTSFDSRGFSYQQPFLGVSYKMVNQTQAKAEKSVAGAYVVNVLTGSPADMAGIKAGDIITGFDKQQLTGNSTDELLRLVARHKVGDKVEITFWRKQQNLIKNITLVAMPVSQTG